MIDKREIKYADGRMQSYLEAGSGSPLVLLHGIGSTSESFRDQLLGLSDAFRVIAWDAPGYGLSSFLKSPAPTAADYAVAVAEFVDSLGLQRFHLLGHSLGCLMAAGYAAMYSDRLLTLSLCSIATGHSHLSAQRRLELRDGRIADVQQLGPRGMAEKRGPRLLAPNANPDHIKRVVDVMATVNSQGYTQAAHLLSQGDIKSDLAGVSPRLPIQIIYGDMDVITPPAENRQIASLLTNPSVSVIADTGHALYVENAASFNAIVRDFVRAHEQPS